MYFSVFKWVLWNTFLALIPVVAAYLIVWLARMPRKHLGALAVILLTILGAIWLAFLPNTCYLLTEWRHFFATIKYTSLYTQWCSTSNSDALVQLVGYTLFYLCYSGFGMLTFTLAVRPLVRLNKDKGILLWILALPFFTLVSIGVYLGLILRFNSWDLLQHPGAVWAAIAAIPGKPLLVTFILAFAAFLWLGYTALDIFIDGLSMRFKRGGK